MSDEYERVRQEVAQTSEIWIPIDKDRFGGFDSSRAIADGWRKLADKEG